MLLHAARRRPGEPIEVRSLHDGALWAIVREQSVLDGMEPAPDFPVATRVIMPPGFLADEDDPGAPDPRTWGPRGWDALIEGVDTLVAQSTATILLRPVAGHVVSDAPSCLRFLRLTSERWNTGDVRVGVALDAAAMLAPSMVPLASDHLARILEIVAGEPGVAAVYATNVAADGNLCRTTPLAEGVVPAEELAALLRHHVPASTPLIVVGADAASDAHLLARG